MRTAMIITSRIANRPVWSAMLLVNITRMVTNRFMTLWCAWSRNFLCACHCWTDRAISARSMATRPPPCVTPKCVWPNRRRRCLRISTRTRSIFRTIMIIPSANRWFCQRVSRIYWSMVPMVLPSAWRPMCRRTISVNWSMQRRRLLSIMS